MTPWLTSLAVATGAAAFVLSVIAAQGKGDGNDPSGGAWLLGLAILLAPFLGAATTWSVSSSSLLRPVGGVAVVACALAASLHVAVAVDARGSAGWAYAAPALATTALLFAAVIGGPRHRPRRKAGERVAQVSQIPPGAEMSQIPTGPPLDVVTPLREARDHAIKVSLAWLGVLVVAAAVTAPLFRVLGWPTVAGRLDAQVVQIRGADGGTVVTFTALDGRRPVQWTQVSESPHWDVGDRSTVFVDADGQLHFDQQLGLAGTPLLLPFWIPAGFAALAIRRLWGLLVALWDVHHGDDRPRLAYAAVLDDPSPKAHRPLLAVWANDPTTAPRLRKPDAVYRADPTTGEDLQSVASLVVVRRAWVDTGRWKTSKPRWVGFEHGVCVPHRRSFLGRWYVRKVTRHGDAGPVITLHHAPPNPSAQLRPLPGSRSLRGLGVMVAWRLLALVAGIVLSLLIGRGEPVSTEPVLALDPAHGVAAVEG